MKLEKALVGSSRNELRSDLQALRSAKTIAGRRRRHEGRAKAAHDADSRRAKRRRERDLEELLRARVRVRVPPERRPSVGRLMRRLRNEGAGFLPGEVGRSDSRGRDGLYSIYFEFTARGLTPRSGRAWKRGEAKRAVLYIIVDEGLEDPERGWLSNVGTDPAEIASLMDLLEDMAREERANANVYISEIIALPAELTAEQRWESLRDICSYFEERGLPYVAAPHKPSAAGDQRNFHAHIIYSRHAVERIAPFEWRIGLDQDATINTPAGIAARRRDVVACINHALESSGSSKRHTAASRAERGLGRGERKRGKEQTVALRRLTALEADDNLLDCAAIAVSAAMDLLIHGSARLDELRKRAAERLRHTREVDVPDVEARRAKVIERCREVQGSSSTVSLSRRLLNVRHRAGAISKAEADRRQAAVLRNLERETLSDGFTSEPQRLTSASHIALGRLREARRGALKVTDEPEEPFSARSRGVRIVLRTTRQAAVAALEECGPSYRQRERLANALTVLSPHRRWLEKLQDRLNADHARLAELKRVAREREAAAADDRRQKQEIADAKAMLKIKADGEALVSDLEAQVAERHRRTEDTWSILRQRIFDKLRLADRRPVVLIDDQLGIVTSLLTPQETAFFGQFGRDLIDHVRHAHDEWSRREAGATRGHQEPHSSTAAPNWRDSVRPPPRRGVYEDMMADVDAIGWPIHRDLESGRYEVDGLDAQGAAILHCETYADETQGRLKVLFEIRALISAIDLARREPGHVRMEGDALHFPHFSPLEAALLERHRSHEEVRCSWIR